MSTAGTIECCSGMGRPQGEKHRSTKPIDQINREKIALSSYPARICIKGPRLTQAGPTTFGHNTADYSEGPHNPDFA